ncbi:DUF3320 domain-containing protein [Plantibacter sp. CFBP 8798]|nr:DUF4011 domain-containing protein [Plantibacter sp. CFBP 8798]MBD8467819.1 DUF3320 domain-containing protein [Plantibacter sp. CFBP 8798]
MKGPHVDASELNSAVGEGLEQLGLGLRPVVEGVFAEAVPGVEWTRVIEEKDRAAGIGHGRYSAADVSLMLRAMTERIGELGYPFDRVLSRSARGYASELREVRNAWAHNAGFTDQSAYRALDSMQLLLESVEAAERAAVVGELKGRVLSPSTSSGTGGVGSGSEAGALTKTASEDEMGPSTGSGTGAVASTGLADGREAEDGQSAAGSISVDGAEGSLSAEDAAAAPSAVTIRVSATPTLSYAMAHCSIAVIDEIVLENHGGERRAASVEIDVVTADGALADTKVFLADLGEDRTTLLRSPEVLLDPRCMLLVEEQRPGVIRVTVRDAAGTQLGTVESPVTVLASNQWIAAPVQLGLELLAAHVQPNALVVSELMLEVSDILDQQTGNSSLATYQLDDPARIDAIVAAVWDAARARDIRYAEPPASWGQSGQKVRTPEEVLTSHLGTCLDTTILLASVLEAIGIHPLLWLLKDHIFLGYWRVQTTLDVVASTDVSEAVNSLELGRIGVVETTMLTGTSATFADASRRPHTDHLAGSLDDFIGVTDVVQARLRKIYPLPSRRINAEGEPVVTLYQAPEARALTQDAPATAESTAAGHGPDVPKRVSTWKNALLDLSLRNKLINYTDRSGFELAVPGPALGRLEDSINHGTSLTLVASDSVATIDQQRGIRFGRDLDESDRITFLDDKKSAFIDVTEAAYPTKLRALAYKAKTIVEETGANNLYLAFGMLSWRFGDRDLRSPLVLVPVTLTTTSRGSSYRLTLDESGSSTPNYCLLEKLRLSFGLEIPGLANPVEDGSGIDLPAAFTAVRQAILDAGLPFRVEETASLSILQFAKYRLWKDLDENWETLASNSLVDHLINSPLEAYADPTPAQTDTDLDRLGLDCPVAADSSQLDAVAEAVAGRTFVLEGPPGTGKSQTITNLLARSLAEGKKVLFVAEKRAALNVVKQRLEDVGLGAFSLDLHDKGARPNVVRAQIKTGLDLRTKADIDALSTNRELSESGLRTLTRYADRLHEVNAAGFSLYSARSRLLAMDHDLLPMAIPEQLVAAGTPEAFEELRRVFRDLPERSDLARPSTTHPWAFLDGPSAPGLDAATVQQAARALDAALAATLDDGLPMDALRLASRPDLLGLWSTAVAAPRLPIGALMAGTRPEDFSRLDDALAAAEQLRDAQAEWRSTFTPAILDRDIAGPLHAAEQAAASSFFGRKKRLRAALAQLSDVLAVDATSFKVKQLVPQLTEAKAAQDRLVQLRGTLRSTALPLVGDRWNPLVEPTQPVRELLGWYRWLSEGFRLPGKPDDAFITAVRDHYATTQPSQQAAQALTTLASTWSDVLRTAAVSTERLSAWSGGEGFLQAWWSTRDARRLDAAEPVVLERWLDLVRVIEPLRTHGLDDVRAAILAGRIETEDATLAFEKGLAQASIDERERTTTLDAFDATAHNRSVTRFTTSVKAVREELPRAIPASVLGLRTFSSQSESGQVGGLRRQIDRQRGGMSVRALLENFGELITQIMPCTLASPESVARFFPAAAELFDIVVFDEASQIRVADAIGAMGRSRSVVVVGDSKQMPPTTFAEAGATIDDDADYTSEVLQDEESILSECVQARVPSKWLSWHYRSQDESLIAFSNHHYYDSQLSSFPAPFAGAGAGDGGVAGHGLAFVRLDGQFERGGRGKSLRTNPVEAQAIVEEISRRFEASPDETPSLGVITFNAQQRTLIEDLLRDSADPRVALALDEQDGLFVKNLENVQGDERDTILFSIAFSANEKGVIPLNFGPLTRAGGERRLNVAVTRARRQVVLFASFDPSELRAEQTSSIGIKHLKAYLELAQRGSEAAGEDGRRQAISDRHRDEIADELRYAGHAVRTDVGLSDFRVDISIATEAEPDRPLVAVLLDGASWRERRTVADRDGLPVEVLSGLMRWPGVERVWLPEWLHHREEVLDRLVAAVEAAAERAAAGSATAEASGVTEADPADASVTDEADVAPDASDAPAPVRSARVREWSERLASLETLSEFRDRKVGSAQPVEAAPVPDTSARHPELSEYEPWDAPTLGGIEVLDRLPGRQSVVAVQGAIRAAVEAEGPIHMTRLAKLVAGAFGLDRVVGSRAKSILDKVPAELLDRSDEPFAWPTSIDPLTWRGARQSSAEAARAIEHISLAEIANAMAIAAEESAGLSPDELRRETLAIFGGKRVTAAIGARLDEALEFGLASGRVRQSGETIVAQTV